MSYNPVSTNSRSNSPIPFAGRSSLQQSYDQNRGTSEELHPRPYRSADQASYSSPLTKHNRLIEQIPTRNPFEPEIHDPITTSSSSHSLQQHSNYSQQQRQQYPVIDNGRSSFSSSYYLSSPLAPGMKSFQGTSGAASSAGSYDARDNNSSHRSSARNLGVQRDNNYNFTQTDSTLEVLEERWNAYQAWWAKQYKEQPFYKIWTKSKWILLLSTLLLLGYSCAAFGISLGYILGNYEHAVVVMEFHGKLVYITLIASTLGIMNAILGLVGIFKENRILLSWYSIFLWPIFGLYISVGYISFRRAKNHLRAHLKDEWVHSYTREQRLVVQRNLKCCGYQDPTWYGEYDLRCFPMINLPGCQHKYNLYEDKLLTTCWTVSFILVPFQLFVMIVGLLCSNHVDGMLRSGRPGMKTFKQK